MGAIANRFVRPIEEAVIGATGARDLVIKDVAFVLWPGDIEVEPRLPERSLCRNRWRPFEHFLSAPAEGIVSPFGPKVWSQL